MRSKDFVRGKNRTHIVMTRMNDEELEELKRRKGNIPVSYTHLFVRETFSVA